MATTVYTGGFAGGAQIVAPAGLGSSYDLLMTGGGFDRARSRSFIEALDIPPPSNGFLSRSRMFHADGVDGYTGSLQVDITADALSLLSTAVLVQRGYSFDVYIHDGVKARYMEDVMWTSIGLSGSPGGLLSMSLSFVGTENSQETGSYSPDYVRDDAVYGYWWSGKDQVREWSLSINQDVQPVYLNADTVNPNYLRVGLWDMGLEVTTFDSIKRYSDILIVTKTFTITGVTTSEGYSFGGVTAIGNYRHSFESAADADAVEGSAGTVITIA